MKYIASLLFIISSIMSFSQGDINVDRKECWEKGLENFGSRYVEWECGKTPGIVDCNENMEMDPGTNTVFSSKSGRPFTGTCETCHSNGTNERTVSFVNGKENGESTTTYASGCPRLESMHVQGVENGRWTYYFDSTGTIAWQIGYLNGDKHGKSIYYKQRKLGTKNVTVQAGKEGKEIVVKIAEYDVDTVKIENYQNGLLHGKKTEYWKDSKVRKEANYKAGVLDGVFKTYNSKGLLLEDLNYKDGKKDGDFKYYWSDGKLLKTEKWTMGVKDGEFKTFYIQQFPQTIENYKKGKKDGFWQEFYPDQKIKRQTTYKKDEIIDDKEFDKFGNLIGGKTDEDAPEEEDDSMPMTDKEKKAAAKAKKKAEKAAAKAAKKKAKEAGTPVE